MTSMHAGYGTGNYGNQGPNNPPPVGPGFAFRRRQERLDWRKLGAVDVDRISRELDYRALQDNVMNVTFCNIDQEIDPRTLDPNFVKLFKLAQLTIEYLLHSQQYLTDTILRMETQLRKVGDHRHNAINILDHREDELKASKKENKKRRKIIETQQAMMTAGSNNYHKCPYCAKAFLGPQYLQDHLERRHIEQIEKSDSNKANQALEKEIERLKERLKDQEDRLERDRNNSLAREQALLLARSMGGGKEEGGGEWRIAQLESQQRQMESLRESLLKEVRELTGKQSQSESNLREALSRRERRANREDEDELMRKQREELAIIKESLRKKMFDVDGMVKESEGRWKSRLKQLKEEHREEVRRLNGALEDTNSRLRLVQEGAGSSGSYNAEVEALQSRVREQREEIERLEREHRREPIERALTPPERALTPTERARTPPRPPPRRRPPPPSDDDVTDTEEVLLPFTYSKSPRLLAALKRDPRLLAAAKPGLIKGIEADLYSRGIPQGAKAISDAAFGEAMGRLRLERKEFAREIGSDEYGQLRRAVAADVDRFAKERMESRAKPRRNQKVKFVSRSGRGHQGYGGSPQRGHDEYRGSPGRGHDEYRGSPGRGHDEYRGSPERREYGGSPQRGHQGYGGSPQRGQREYGRSPQRGHHEYEGSPARGQYPGERVRLKKDVDYQNVGVKSPTKSGGYRGAGSPARGGVSPARATRDGRDINRDSRDVNRDSLGSSWSSRRGADEADAVIDWDDVSELAPSASSPQHRRGGHQPVLTSTPSKKRPQAAARESRGMVAELTESIERQLATRKGIDSAGAGAVDTVKDFKDDDEVSEPFSNSSQEGDGKGRHRHEGGGGGGGRPGSGGQSGRHRHGDAARDSVNSYGSSLWSKSGVGGAPHSGAGPTGVSASSWDTESIEDIHI